MKKRRAARRTRPDPGPARPTTETDVVFTAATCDADEARRNWTAVYDLLLLGRIRASDEIDAYDEPPTLDQE